MTRVDKHRITMDVEYHRPASRYAPISKIKRTVFIDGRKVHVEETLPGMDDTGSAIYLFEQWCVKAEGLLRHKVKGGKNRISNCHNFIGTIKQIWRKLFTKQLDLEP